MASTELTESQRTYLSQRMKGKSKEKALAKAGLSTNSVRQSAYDMEKAIKRKLPDVMDRVGFSDRKLLRKYLRPALEAANSSFHTVKTVTPEGTSEEIVEKQTPNWPTRLTALEMAFKLKGHLGQAQQNQSVTANVAVVWGGDNPSWLNKETAAAPMIELETSAIESTPDSGETDTE